MLGLLASIALVRRRFFGKSAVSALLLSPLIIPVIVFAIALLILFTQIDKLPVIEFPLSMWTLVIGHVVLLVARRDPDPGAAASSGSTSGSRRPRAISAPGRFRTFRSITLPLIWPALLSAFLVSLVFSFDEIILASFIAGDATTFPLYLFSQLRFPSLLPQVIAVAVIVFAVSMVVVLATEIGRRRRRAPAPDRSRRHADDDGRVARYARAPSDRAVLGRPRDGDERADHDASGASSSFIRCETTFPAGVSTWYWVSMPR